MAETTKVDELVAQYEICNQQYARIEKQEKRLNERVATLLPEEFAEYVKRTTR
jgi:chaperonin cofactor prefoldin